MLSRECSAPHPTPGHWISNVLLVHCQSLLWGPPYVKYHSAFAINLTTLLPHLDLDIKHDCSIMLSHNQNLRPDPTDIPWLDVGMIYSSDRTSFMQGESGMQVWRWWLLTLRCGLWPYHLASKS